MVNQLRSPPSVGIMLARELCLLDSAVVFKIIIQFLILINFICHELLVGFKTKKKNHVGLVVQADYKNIDLFLLIKINQNI